MFTAQLFLFSATWIAVIYGIDSLIAGKPLDIKNKVAPLYVLSMAALGLVGEIAFDASYKFAFGRPLWQYHLLPIHSAYTSLFSIFLWGVMGLHLYLLHGALRKRGVTSTHTLALLFCLEAVALEALVNVTYRAIFKGYVFYYLPTDLWHITSLQTLPLYLLAGYATVFAMRLSQKLPRQALIGNSLAIAAVLIIR